MRTIPNWAYALLAFGCVLLSVTLLVGWLAGEQISDLRFVIGVGGFLILCGLLWVRYSQKTPS